jgi:hypothetical protein
MGLKRYQKSLVVVLFFALLLPGACLAEPPGEPLGAPLGEAEDTDSTGPDTAEYKEGLLDEVVSRGKGLPPKKYGETGYETFDEKLHKEKEEQRVKDIGKERARDLEGRLEVLY